MEGKSGQMVTFYLGRELFGIGLDCVQEIIMVPEMVRVPGTSPYFSGLANLRGSILPVINLRKKLELPGQEHDDRARIVVVDLEGTPTGLIVDAVREVRKIAQAQVEDVPSVLKSLKGAACLSGVVVQGDGQRSVLLLNLENIINASEREEVSRLAEEAAVKGLLLENLPGQPADGEEERAEEGSEL